MLGLHSFGCLSFITVLVVLVTVPVLLGAPDLPQGWTRSGYLWVLAVGGIGPLTLLISAIRSCIRGVALQHVLVKSDYQAHTVTRTYEARTTHEPRVWWTRLVVALIACAIVAVAAWRTPSGGRAPQRGAIVVPPEELARRALASRLNVNAKEVRVVDTARLTRRDVAGPCKLGQGDVTGTTPGVLLALEHTGHPGQRYLYFADSKGVVFCPAR